MFYFLKSKNQLVSMEQPPLDMLVKPDINDLRNYAFIYIYPNNEMDVAIRTINLPAHSYAIEPLFHLSKNLKPYYQKYKELNDITHFNLDEALASDGALVIYYSISDLLDESAFGYIYLPSELTKMQREFIQSHRIYFEVYEDLLICQYDRNSQELVSLNELGDRNFLEILDRVSNPSLEDEGNKRTF